jgi:hypothetical protein
MFQQTREQPSLRNALRECRRDAQSECEDDESCGAMRECARPPSEISESTAVFGPALCDHRLDTALAKLPAMRLGVVPAIGAIDPDPFRPLEHTAPNGGFQAVVVIDAFDSDDKSSAIEVIGNFASANAHKSFYRVLVRSGNTSRSSDICSGRRCIANSSHNICHVASLHRGYPKSVCSLNDALICRRFASRPGT